ncbi:TPA: hypothetical protein ACS7Y7_003776 [Providencia alcalifaciens]
MFVICYLLFVICYLLFVICYLLFVICYLLFVLVDVLSIFFVCWYYLHFDFFILDLRMFLYGVMRVLIMFSSIGQSTCRMVNNPCIRAAAEISFKQERNSGGILSRLFGVRREMLSVQVNNRNVNINITKVNKEVDKAILHSGVHKPSWFCQETVTHLSAEVNKTIDRTCHQQAKNISNIQKERIFAHLSNRLASGVKLDSRCTQSSIGHILRNSSYVTHKLENLVSSRDMSSHEKNEIKNIVTSKLTDIVFEDKFGGVSVEQLRKDATREVEAQLKRYSAPF